MDMKAFRKTREGGPHERKSNQQPQPILISILLDPTPQRDRRIMRRRIRAEGHDRGGRRRGEEAISQQTSEELEKRRDAEGEINIDKRVLIQY